MALYWDDVDGRLYVLRGNTYLIVQGIDTVPGIAYYEQGLWHGMGDGITHGNPLALTGYDGAVVVGGTIWEVDSLPNSAHIAAWQNETWQPMLPDQEPPEIVGSVSSLTVLDGELHALGSMDWIIDGQPANGWAIWNGTEWRLGDTSGFFADPQWTVYIKQVCDYQGQRYAGGNFQAPGQPNDLARWNGSAWEEVGGGINGDPWVNELVVYDGRLWVAGEFAASSGNAANGLMTWDGVQWADPFPNISFTAQCRKLLLANDKLYFCGPYLAQGLSGVYRFGVFDGEQLCVFGGAELFNADCIAASADTLYAYCYIDGTDVTGISRWPLNGPMDTCYQIVQGVPQSSGEPNALTVYPSPATNSVRVTCSNALSAQARQVAMYNSLGQLILHVPATGTTTELDISSLAAGSYTVQLQDVKSKPLASGTVIKQQ